MKLSHLRLSNFQCFGEFPTVIDFEDALSVLIGLNGTGKTAALQALSRLFGISESSRKIRVEDFHYNGGNTTPSMFIEAWFTFPELSDGTPEVEMDAVAGTFNQLSFSDVNGDLLLRIRLEAKLTFDEISPEGVVNDSVYYILTDSDPIPDTQKKELRRVDRNNIQVHYIPANRNPLKEISSSTKVLLGRVLNAINWDRTEAGELSQALQNTRLASEKLEEHGAIKLIEAQLQANWEKMYTGGYLSKTKINFLPLQIEELLKTVSLSFLPDTTGQIAAVDRLSDGQRSLLYITIIQAVHELESIVLREAPNLIHFDPDKLKQPIFTLLALEEPENHLAPHYLGRIITSMKTLADRKDAQVIVTTHSPNLVGRVEPEQLRYFRFAGAERITLVSKIPLPEKTDELYKFVTGAVKAYPEIYFARLVVLGEGESELIVIPKVLSQAGLDVDDSFITVAPLGGKHVNHFWRLLSGLEIPYVTLLDLDYGRNGGGWGRVKYVCDQHKKYKGSELLTNVPNWDDTQNPMTSQLKDSEETALQFLEKNGIFFSSPIDIDFAMQTAFPEFYMVKLLGERGPRSSDWLKLKEAVLKESYSPELSEYYLKELQQENFMWYRYRFLGNKGKPTSHLYALENIGFSEPDIQARIPGSLMRLVTKVEAMIKGLPE